MDVLPQHGVQAIAGGTVVTRVRPRAGQEHTDDDRDRDGERREMSEECVRARDRQMPKARLAVHARQVHRSDRHEPCGDEVVHADDARVQVEPYRDAADDGLQDDAQTHDECQACELRTGVPKPNHGEECGQSDRDKEAGEGTVPELDDAVIAQLVRRDERVRGAQRPRRASHAGARESNETAGQHDHDVGDQQEPRRDTRPRGDLGRKEEPAECALCERVTPRGYA